MKIEEVVERFNTTPFLFVGSGLTRRYYNLPKWDELLAHFAEIVKNDSFAYSSYENKAKSLVDKKDIMPKIAELIQNDFDEKWFNDSSIRTVGEEQLEKIKRGLSPFKAEIAQYIIDNSIVEKKYEEEIAKLAEISKNSIAGVITTNYDTFLEENFEGFKKYVGQNQLIFSAIQGIAEIYKIHGSVEYPESIVINQQDYIEFSNKSAYLAAKLMTIFMEYPIIFMGYSISDQNVLDIIEAIVNCLDEEQLKVVEDRFIFVEYKEGQIGSEITPYTIMIDNKPLRMTKITIDNFQYLYNALEGKKAKLPVRILRRFKEELYKYTVTNTPTANLRVAEIEDQRVKDEDLAIAIGRKSDLGLKGLSGLEGDEWYRNIILDDLDFSADELIEYAFSKLLKQNSNMLPVNKYLSEATKDFPECKEYADKQTYESLISKTIRSNRKTLGSYSTVKQIWENEKKSLSKATNLIAHLTEEQMDVTELEEVLLEIFEENVNVLQSKDMTIRTNIRRLIRIFDFLKWGK